MARLLQITRQLNIGMPTAVDFLNKKHQPIEENPNAKLTDIQEQLLTKEFSSDKSLKEQSEKLIQQRQDKEKSVLIAVDSHKIENEVTKKAAVKKSHEKPAEIVEEKVAMPIEIEIKNKEIPMPEIKEQTVVTAELPPVEQKIEVVEKTQQSEVIDKKPVEQKEKKVEKTVQKGQIEKAGKSVKTEKQVDKKAENQQTAKSEDIKKKEEKIKEQQEQPKIDEKPAEEVKQEGNNKETEIFKYKSKFAPKIGFKMTGEKIDLKKVAEPPPMYKLSREEKKAKYKQLERQKREAVKIIKQQQQKEQNKGKVDNKNDKKWFEKGKKDNNAAKPTEPPKEVIIETKVPVLQGTKVVGKIELNAVTPTSSAAKKKNKRDRKRIGEDRVEIDNRQIGKKVKYEKNVHGERRGRSAVSGENINQNIKETLAKLTEGKKFNKQGVKHRHNKREAIRENIQEKMHQKIAESKKLKITEFITANELAIMMNVSVNEVIKTYMNIGMFVGINQRLDAETINIVAEEFGFKTEYVSADTSSTIKEDEDNPDDLVARPPVITVMGHVDHGKTSLLDYIRKTNVIAGEAGGITQHIGAYNVALEDGRHITFLDTPGHSAFTAMRARGAKITDIAIIVVAADDDVMPQTIEAINHATAASVPIVFAINKIDKDGADPEKIKGTLANMNYLVEAWGGKYQSQDISAKKGIGVQELLEKVLLEAEMLELKANPERKASGSVIEFTKDKGRGNVATMLIQNGTLKVGDIVVAGYAYGKIRAMFNERNQKITEAKPAEPVMVLGMRGEMQAGDNFNVTNTEHEAREIVNSRDQLKREVKLRTTQHITLDEIGRRIALGNNFLELNLIIKGDVDGSIEALADALIKLSTEEIKVNVIAKSVGQITEGDINLAIASNAIVVGFNVRPAIAARRLAETEQIDIRLYSIIYQAIEEVKAAMEGMLLPEKSEKVTATLEVRDTFKISKVGTIAGCMVKDGKIKRNSKVRLIRDGIVVFMGEIESLKHEKDDVKEVNSGYECGLNIANFNDIKIGDIIESYEEVEIKKTL